MFGIHSLLCFCAKLCYVIYERSLTESFGRIFDEKFVHEVDGFNRDVVRHHRFVVQDPAGDILKGQFNKVKDLILFDSNGDDLFL